MTNGVTKKVMIETLRERLKTIRTNTAAVIGHNDPESIIEVWDWIDEIIEDLENYKEQDESKIKFGTKARDRVTGFTGIVTGHCKYMYGCDQYDLKPQVDEKNNYQEGRWFDEGRIEVITENVISPEEVQVEKNGGPSKGPKRN